MKYYVDLSAVRGQIYKGFLEKQISPEAAVYFENCICELKEPDKIGFVRCEDCRYYNSYVDYPMGDCMYWMMEEDLPIRLPVYGNDFCSRGDGI